jgi:hypothetical protein
LFVAAKMTEATAKTFAEVAADFKAGKGWGKMVADNEVRLAPIIKSARRVALALEKKGESLKVREQRALERSVALLDATSREAEDVACSHIAKVTGKAVETLRKARAEAGLACGELLVAAQVAASSGMAFADAVAELKAGKAGAEIAAEAGVKLAGITKSAERVEAMVNREREDLQKRVAAEKRNLEKKIAAINAAAKHGEDVVLERISKETGVAIEKLRELKGESGLGFGELLVATEIAAASGKTFADVVAEFKAGKGWGSIAADSNVELGGLIKSTGHVQAMIDRDQHGRIMAQSNGQVGVNRGSTDVSGSFSATGSLTGRTLPTPPPIPNLIPRK